MLKRLSLIFLSFHWLNRVMTTPIADKDGSVQSFGKSIFSLTQIFSAGTSVQRRHYNLMVFVSIIRLLRGFMQYFFPPPRECKCKRFMKSDIWVVHPRQANCLDHGLAIPADQQWLKFLSVTIIKLLTLESNIIKSVVFDHK